MNICKAVGKWYWLPHWMNHISYKESGWKLYRWGYWNFSFNYKEE